MAADLRKATLLGSCYAPPSLTRSRRSTFKPKVELGICEDFLPASDVCRYTKNEITDHSIEVRIEDALADNNDPALAARKKAKCQAVRANEKHAAEL